MHFLRMDAVIGDAYYYLDLTRTLVRTPFYLQRSNSACNRTRGGSSFRVDHQPKCLISRRGGKLPQRPPGCSYTFPSSSACYPSRCSAYQTTPQLYLHLQLFIYSVFNVTRMRALKILPNASKTSRAGQWVDTSFSSHYYSFVKSG